jgi:transposase-like protein
LVDIFRKVDTMSAMADTRSRRVRRRFTDEFKQQAVRLVLDEGKGVAAVARELDLVPSALGQWVKQAQADRSKGRTGLLSNGRYVSNGTPRSTANARCEWPVASRMSRMDGTRHTHCHRLATK